MLIIGFQLFFMFMVFHLTTDIVGFHLYSVLKCLEKTK